jgi:hypothetical protein
MAKKKRKTRKRLRVDYSIDIFVGLTGLIYSDGDLVVKPGDRVRWRCATNSWAIHFDAGISPFVPNTPFIVAPAGTYSNFYPVRSPKKWLPHKYSVAVNVGGNNPILTDDPQVIIDDSGGTGRRTGKQKTGSHPK